MKQKKAILVWVKMNKEVYDFFNTYFSNNGMSLERVLNDAPAARLAIIYDESYSSNPSPERRCKIIRLAKLLGQENFFDHNINRE